MQITRREDHSCSETERAASRRFRSSSSAESEYVILGISCQRGCRLCLYSWLYLYPPPRCQPRMMDDPAGKRHPIHPCVSARLAGRQRQRAAPPPPHPSPMSRARRAKLSPAYHLSRILFTFSLANESADFNAV